MKNTTKKKGNPQKKLIPAAGSLLISAVMLGTSTYAWFTMNKTVQVTGMTMQTKVSGNLLICQDNVENHYKPDTITQNRKALLEPVSSTTGATGSFWYTINATADGQKNSGNYTAYAESDDLDAAAYDILSADGYTSTGAAKTDYDAAFNGAAAYNIGTAAANADAAYGNAYGYVDYTFYLKATGDAANQLINMTWCNILRSADSGETYVALEDNNAWRIALFAEELASNDTHAGVYATDVATSGNQKTILGLSGANYFTDGSAVSGASAVTAVTRFGTGAVVGSVNAGETKYYKVVVRVWLEGEDEDCFSANYAPKEELYKLDLAFELGKGAAKEEITTTTAAFSAAANPAV